MTLEAPLILKLVRHNKGFILKLALSLLLFTQCYENNFIKYINYISMKIEYIFIIFPKNVA